MRAAVMAQLSDEQKSNNTTEGFEGFSSQQLKALTAQSKDSPSSVAKRKYHERRRTEAKTRKDAEEDRKEGKKHGSLEC